MSTTPDTKQEHSPTLEELSALVQEVVKQNKKIQSRLTWMAVTGTLKLLFWLIPLVLAFVYLPTIISEGFEQYKKWFNVSRQAGATGTAPFVIPQVSPEQVEQVLKILQQSPKQ